MQLVAEEVDAVCTIREVANGELDEAQLATWILSNSSEFDPDAG